MAESTLINFYFLIISISIIYVNLSSGCITFSQIGFAHGGIIGGKGKTAELHELSIPTSYLSVLEWKLEVSVSLLLCTKCTTNWILKTQNST